MVDGMFVVLRFFILAENSSESQSESDSESELESESDSEEDEVGPLPRKKALNVRSISSERMGRIKKFSDPVNTILLAC